MDRSPHVPSIPHPNEKTGNPPLPSTTPQTNGRMPISVIKGIRNKLNRMFDRSVDEVWSYYEESGLAEVITRAGVEDELAIIINYRQSLPTSELKFMFPSTMGKLLHDWTGTLDKARAGSYKPEKKADPNVFCYGRAKFTKETPPKREDFKDDSSFSGCMAMYQKWLETPKPPTGA